VGKPKTCRVVLLLSVKGKFIPVPWPGGRLVNNDKIIYSFQVGFINKGELDNTLKSKQ
jgi:hypothetical protein